MISKGQNTQAQHLARLLVEIGESEAQIEVLREILCEQITFEPYTAFRRLDIAKTGYISSLELFEFLRLNDCNSHTLEDLDEYFIVFHDFDGDSKLSYAEFLKIVLPKDNPELRSKTSQRPIYDVGPGGFLTYEVEYALTRLFDREITLHKTLNPLKQSILHLIPPETSITSLFFLIDLEAKNQIDFVTLKKFLKRVLNFKLSDEEIIRIIRWIDRRDDAILTPQDLLLAITPRKSSVLAASIRSPSREVLIPRRESPLKSAIITEKLVRSPSYSRNPSLGHQRAPGQISHGAQTATAIQQRSRHERSRSRSPTKPGDITADEDNMKYQEYLSRTSGTMTKSQPKRSRTKDNKKSASSKKKAKSPRLVTRLITFFQTLLIYEKELEGLRKELAVQPDFNLFDAFRYFDENNVATLSPGQMLTRLEHLRIITTPQNVELLLKRLCPKNKNHILRYTARLR